jgi:hypothetical protein
MRGKRTLARLGVIPLLLLGTACSNGGGGGSPTAADPNAPVITNLRATLGQTCTFSGNLPGTEGVLVVDYADADGNVRGGVLEFVGTFPVGGSFTVTGAIPSPGVTVTGTTSGTVTAAACIRFGGNARFTLQVKVTDASGKVSNVLTLEVPNPGGVPLGTRGSDGAPGMALEPQ